MLWEKRWFEHCTALRRRKYHLAAAYD